MKFNLIVTLSLLSFSMFSHAEEIHLAVAANFTAPMEKLSIAFSEVTGDKAIMTYGSTGKLYAQIKNGAPFEIFLSADQETPKKLTQEGQAIEDTQFTYSIGKLVLWSLKTNFIDPQGEVLKKGRFKHLSIANPKLAPYGAAAQEVMEKLGVWTQVQPRLVTGENIAQAHQFVATGNAELGFVAYSQIKKEGKKTEGSYWVIPQSFYAPIKQDAVLLQNGKKNAAAKKFLEFLKSREAQTIIANFGYDLQ